MAIALFDRETRHLARHRRTALRHRHEPHRSTHPYPSDLSNARWALFEPTLTAWRQARTDRGVGGREPDHPLRDILDAILYVDRTGIPWRYMPHDFPPYQTVYTYFAAWSDEGIFAELDLKLTRLAREKAGRDADPSACVIDCQSVKTSMNAPLATQGADPSKKIVGRKRGIITDVLGLLLAVTVVAANISDNVIGAQLLDQTKTVHPGISKAWVDAGFKRTFIEHAADIGVNVEAVPTNTQVTGFTPVKRRWVVERTWGWIMLHRRLARDYETRPDRSESMIHIAMLDNLAKRITGETAPGWRDPPNTA